MEEFGKQNYVNHGEYILDKENKEFLEDLETLLRKHNVSIGFDFGEDSDMHGVYGECIIAYNNKTDKNLIRIDGYFMDEFDVKRELE